MDEWFEKKFDKNRVREYTLNRLPKRRSIFRALSISNWIIVFNLAIFVVVNLAISILGLERVLYFVALQPGLFFSGSFWTVLTSMFVHIEVWHLAANMVSLFFIGNFVEKLIGRKRLFWLYLFSGIFAGLFYVLLSHFFGVAGIGAQIFGSSTSSAVGASGAIFALLGLLAVLTPNSKVYLIAGPLIVIVLQAVISQFIPDSGVLPLINLFFYIYILFSIIALFSFNPRVMKFALPLQMSIWILPIVAIVPLVVIGIFVPLPIGNSAHFGGLVAGLAYGGYLANRYRKKVYMMRKYFS